MMWIRVNQFNLMVIFLFLLIFQGCGENKEDNVINEDQGPYKIYFYFSHKSCPPCMCIVDVLNNLADVIDITGVVSDLSKIDKSLYSFKLVDHKEDNLPQNIMFYNPSIVGITKKGRLLFALPCVPNQDKYLEDFLVSLHSRVAGMSL